MLALVLNILGLALVLLTTLMEKPSENLLPYLSRIPRKTMFWLLFATLTINAVVLVLNYFDEEKKSKELTQTSEALTETNALLKQTNAQNQNLQGQVEGFKGVVDKLFESAPSWVQQSSQASRDEIGRFREEQNMAWATAGRSALARTLDGYEIEFVCNGVESCRVATNVRSILLKHNPRIVTKEPCWGVCTPDYARRWLDNPEIEGDSILYRFIHDQPQVNAIASLAIEEFPKLRFNYLPTTANLPAENTIYVLIRSDDHVRERPTPVPVP